MPVSMSTRIPHRRSNVAGDQRSSASLPLSLRVSARADEESARCETTASSAATNQVLGEACDTIVISASPTIQIRQNNERCLIGDEPRRRAK